MEFIDLFFVELREIMNFGVFLFFAILGITPILGGIIVFVEWIYSKISKNRISNTNKS